MTTYSIGLALSGGGARGIAHLGVLKALEECGIKPGILSGTSAGAIVGALYAYGYSTNDILKILIEIKAFKFLRPALNSRGLLKIEVVRDFLNEYLPENDFKSLKIPLIIAATNIRTGQSEYFETGDLNTIICASCCIPVLFDPVKYNNEYYIDGGILNNLPIEVLSNRANTIIGCHSNPVDDDFKLTNFSSVMERALMLAITRNARLSIDQCDFVIEPKGLEGFKVMDIGKAKEIFNIGYQQAIIQIDEFDLKEKLNITT